MLKHLFIATAALTAFPAIAAPRDTPDVKMQKALAGRVAGKPVNCIMLSNARSTQIIDDRAIIYRSGGTLYVNTPRTGAASLDEDDILVTRTTGGQLCSLDTVRLVDRASRIETGFVALGEFVPYTRPRRN